MIFISIFTASYNIVIIISSLIVVHELGHFLCAKFLGIEVDKIIIYPLGGISKFKMPLNISIFKEFLVLISGPLFQFVAYFLLSIFWGRYQKIINLYHYSILIFNLLPIYPLDGGKLINLFLETKLPYRTSLIVTIFISYIVLIGLVLINYKNIQLNLIIMVLFLTYKLIQEQKRINYLYNKFLLERYLNKYRFSKSKIITNPGDFYRNKRHLVKENGQYYLENEYLEKKFKKVLTL